VLEGGGTVVRATNLIGPGMSTNNVLADILGQLTQPGPVVLRALTPVRDYLWVDDVAALLTLVAEQQKGGVFNGASGRVVSVGELAELVLAAAKQSGRRLVETCPIDYNSRIELNITSTTQAFGWAPKTSLEVALQTLVNKDRPPTTS
jgi:UDP-glucose 4-epimerase